MALFSGLMAKDIIVNLTYCSLKPINDRKFVKSLVHYGNKQFYPRSSKMLINTSYNPCTSIISTLAAIGAVNWGLVGIFNFNLVTYLLGDYPTITKIVYVLVGLSGLWSLCSLSKVLCSPSIQKAD